ncbi:MAG TPA: GNAT family N-acetyltransferase [Anaerolineales bacterium]|jgi:ribosomal protein S18 acetylase RimI-like enzyme|nr:GNAT family N-acetyltransferase [Anaerolineales bacterium]
MSSITIPVKTKEHPHLRPLNVLRDLSAVADLIELCFSPTMDNEGQRYLSDMRRASRDDSFLRWASRMSETASMPLMGYVWEQDGRIVGNASLIPFRDRGKRIYLIANVATHPDYRRRGIGRALTERVMKQARDKKASAIWLHVRDDNPGAIELYQQLGFREMARRTTWQGNPDPRLTYPDTGIRVVPRHSHFWPLQQDWLRRLYPRELSWYQSWNVNALRPGLSSWFYLLFVDFNIKQWAAVRRDELLATLAWVPHGGRSESLYAATGSVQGGEALTSLLIHARRTITYSAHLTLDYPGDEMVDAIRAAGFQPRRTLIWMRAA